MRSTILRNFFWCYSPLIIGRNSTRFYSNNANNVSHWRWMTKPRVLTTFKVLGFTAAAVAGMFGKSYCEGEGDGDGISDKKDDTDVETVFTQLTMNDGLDEDDETVKFKDSMPDDSGRGWCGTEMKNLVHCAEQYGTVHDNKCSAYRKMLRLCLETKKRRRESGDDGEKVDCLEDFPLRCTDLECPTCRPLNPEAKFLYQGESGDQQGLASSESEPCQPIEKATCPTSTSEMEPELPKTEPSEQLLQNCEKDTTIIHGVSEKSVTVIESEKAGHDCGVSNVQEQGQELKVEPSTPTPPSLPLIQDSCVIQDTLQLQPVEEDSQKSQTNSKEKLEQKIEELSAPSPSICTDQPVDIFDEVRPYEEDSITQPATSTQEAIFPPPLSTNECSNNNDTTANSKIPMEPVIIVVPSEGEGVTHDVNQTSNSVDEKEEAIFNHSEFIFMMS